MSYSNLYSPADAVIGAGNWPLNTFWKASDLPVDFNGNPIPPFTPGTMVDLVNGGFAVFAKASASIPASTAVCNLTTKTAIPDTTPTFTAGSNVVSFASTAHGRSNGDRLEIVAQTAGTNNALLNGIWTISGVTTNAFTVTINTAPTTGGAGTAITNASGNAKAVLFTMAASGGTYLSPNAAMASGDYGYFIKTTA